MVQEPPGTEVLENNEAVWRFRTTVWWVDGIARWNVIEFLTESVIAITIGTMMAELRNH